MFECTKTVIMNDGEDTQAFTEGTRYRPYSYSFKEGWDTIRKCICTKNDQGKRHIIIDKDEKDSLFFDEHFKEVYV
jgi:hypothetical protein